MSNVSPTVYDKGDKVRLSATFSVSGVNSDPTAVVLKVKDPSSNIATYTYALAEITKSATGIYYKDISIDESGEWYYRFEGTGAVEAADESRFIGDESEF